jgi:hypothetical protein
MLRRTTIQGVFAHLPEAKAERDFRPKPPSPSQTGILRTTNPPNLSQTNECIIARAAPANRYMDGFDALQMSGFPVAARDLRIQCRRHFAVKAQLGNKSYPVA